jgi:hypothetical protein
MFFPPREERRRAGPGSLPAGCTGNYRSVQWYHMLLLLQAGFPAIPLRGCMCLSVTDDAWCRPVPVLYACVGTGEIPKSFLKRNHHVVNAKNTNENLHDLASYRVSIFEIMIL